MLPISSQDVVRFIPSEFSEEARDKAIAAGEGDLSRFDAPPTYLLKAPDGRALAEIAREKTKYNIRWPSAAQLQEALIRSIKRFIHEDDRDRCIEIVNQYYLATGKKNDPENPFDLDQMVKLTKDFNDIFNAAMAVDDDYADLVASATYAGELVPLIYLAWSLVGGENLPFTLKRDGRRMSDPSLMRIPPAHRNELQTQAINLVHVRPEQEKNSDSPSSSPSPRTNSPMKATTTAGKDKKS